MSDWIEIKKDPKHVARERAKAKELRKSPWWKQQLAKGVCYYCGRNVSRSRTYNGSYFARRARRKKCEGQLCAVLQNL